VTRRAARMLAALEAGSETRNEIFDHQGGFSLLNNGAAELRAAGIHVDCTLEDGEYHYTLLDGHDVANGTATQPPSGCGSVVDVGQHQTGGNGTNADRFPTETSSGFVGAPRTDAVACPSVPASDHLQLELVAA